jgi:hypothetical protein
MNQKRRVESVAGCGSEASPLSAQVQTVAAKVVFFGAISGASPQSYLRSSLPKSNVTTTTNPKTMTAHLRTACAARLLPLLLLALPAAVQAAPAPPPDYTYSDNGDGTITITGYTGAGGDVTIPDTIVGWLVTGIGSAAFSGNTSLTSVTIGTNVTSIGDYAFNSCTNLTGVTILDSVTNIGQYAFAFCSSLVSVTLPNNIESIAWYMFDGCSNLPSITIPGSVASVGLGAFQDCPNLKGVYFKGDIPGFFGDLYYFPPCGCLRYSYEVFLGATTNVTLYFLPGTSGWGSTASGRPTVLWNPQPQTSDTSFGVRTNQFGFNIAGTSNLVIVVEACADLANPDWSPVQTNILTGGSSYFSDPQWTNSPGRFYRLRSP